MNTRVLTLDDAVYWNAIREAAAVMADGGLVVFPTETVYGVGACATVPRGLARLRDLKSRSDGKPFTVHIGSRSAVHRFVPGLGGTARRLVEKLWPGPLTIIFEIANPAEATVITDTSAEHIPAMYHDGTIGIRCPDDRAAMDLLTTTPAPVVAASANDAGDSPPVSFEEAREALDGRVDLMIDGGRTRYAKASTIIRVNNDGYRLIRAGVIDDRTLARLNRTCFLLVCSGNTCRSPMAAGLLRRLLAEKLGCREEELTERGYSVESAGTGAYSGASATPEAVQVLKNRGIDISGHRSQPLGVDQVNRADYIFAMTGRQVQNVRALASHADQRVMTLSDEDIEDPIGGSERDYADCADRIEEALRRRLQEVAL